MSGLEPLICKESLQRACAVYLAAVDALKAHVPEEFASKELPELRQGSFGRHTRGTYQTLTCLLRIPKRTVLA